MQKEESKYVTRSQDIALPATEKSIKMMMRREGKVSPTCDEMVIVTITLRLICQFIAKLKMCVSQDMAIAILITSLEKVLYQSRKENCIICPLVQCL